MYAPIPLLPSSSGEGRNRTHQSTILLLRGWLVGLESSCVHSNPRSIRSPSSAILPSTNDSAYPRLGHGQHPPGYLSIDPFTFPSLCSLVLLVQPSPIHPLSAGSVLIDGSMCRLKLSSIKSSDPLVFHPRSNRS